MYCWRGGWKACNVRHTYRIYAATMVCCIIPSEGLDVMDEMEGIQRRKAMAWWVGWMRFVWFVLRWTCDFCGFFGNWFLIHRRPESPNPACCKFWLGRRSRSWIAQKSCLNGWFKAEPLWQTICWNVFPRAKISRSAILHFFHALNIWKISVWRWEHKPELQGLVSALSFADS